MREAVAKSGLKYRYEELDLRYLNASRFGRDFTDNDMRKPVQAGRIMHNGIVNTTDVHPCAT